MVEKNADCWELFSIVFFSFWYGDVYFILENRVRGVDKHNCCAIMQHQNCSLTVEKNVSSHARKFKIVRRILFICTNCAVFVLFSFLLVTSFEQDSEPAIVAEKMTRLLSEAEPPMRTTQDQEVGLLFLSSFFSLLLHRTSCSVYVNRVRNTYEKSVQRAQRKCKICHEAQMMMMMIVIIIMTIIIIIIIIIVVIIIIIFFFNLIYTKIIVIIIIIIIVVLIVRMKCQQLWLLWVLKLVIKYALAGIRYVNWFFPLEKSASYMLHLEWIRSRIFAEKVNSSLTVGNITES